jgi:hypothetical protein
MTAPVSDGKTLLKEFFASLANRHPVRELPSEEVDRVLDQFRDALRGIGADLGTMPRDRVLDLLCLRQQQLKELLADVLGATWLSTRASILVGVDTVHPVRLTMVARSDGPKITWGLRASEYDDPTAAALLAATTDGDFCFGVCRFAKCRRVFARNRRGRPQIYCSAACKSRGVPSAKKRAKYVAAYRARRRQETLRRACALLRQRKRSEDPLALLRRTFPGWPVKSARHVMRQAEKLLDGERRRAKPRE